MPLNFGISMNYGTMNNNGIKRTILIILAILSILVIGYSYRNVIHKKFFYEAYCKKEITSLFNQIEELYAEINSNKKLIKFLDADSKHTYELEIINAKHLQQESLALGLDNETAQEIYNTSIETAKFKYKISIETKESFEKEKGELKQEIDSLTKIKRSLVKEIY